MLVLHVLLLPGCAVQVRHQSCCTFLVVVVSSEEAAVLPCAACQDEALCGTRKGLVAALSACSHCQTPGVGSAFGGPALLEERVTGEATEMQTDREEVLLHGKKEKRHKIIK